MVMDVEAPSTLQRKVLGISMYSVVLGRSGSTRLN